MTSLFRRALDEEDVTFVGPFQRIKDSISPRLKVLRNVGRYVSVAPRHIHISPAFRC